MSRPCPRCDGCGQIVLENEDTGIGTLIDCPDCDSTGEVDDDTCDLCRGTGIGQHGDINTSKCYACHGTGVKECIEDDMDERYERARDYALEDEA